MDAEDFDIRKVSEVIIDGKSQPINIVWYA
jgi:hypothetical protein